MTLKLARYLPAFLESAHSGGFSGAARKLGLTPAAVSKNVRLLEAEIGVRLFHRTTHSLSLTVEGEQFLQKALPLSKQLETLFLQTQVNKDTPAGKLKVSVPYGFGRLYILPLIQGFHKKYPDIELDLRFEDRVVDMVEESIDVAVGNGLDPDSRLVARQLCELNLQAVAAPSFVEQFGEPKTPEDLHRFPCLNYRSPTNQRLYPWRFADSDGKEIVIDNSHASISVSSVELLADLALQGLGITMTGTWLSKPYLDTGQLVRVLNNYATKGSPIMIYYTSKQNLPAKVRVFIDYVVDHIDVKS